MKQVIDCLLQNGDPRFIITSVTLQIRKNIRNYYPCVVKSSMCTAAADSRQVSGGSLDVSSLTQDMFSLCEQAGNTVFITGFLS